MLNFLFLGYGHQTPLSPEGKSFCIVYALIGIPMTLLLLTAVVERLLIPLGLVLRCQPNQISLETRINLLFSISPDRKHCFGKEKKQINRFKMVYLLLRRVFTNQLIILSEFPVIYDLTFYGFAPKAYSFHFAFVILLMDVA
jgi:hypothetical protein